MEGDQEVGGDQGRDIATTAVRDGKEGGRGRGFSWREPFWLGDGKFTIVGIEKQEGKDGHHQPESPGDPEEQDGRVEKDVKSWISRRRRRPRKNPATTRIAERRQMVRKNPKMTVLAVRPKVLPTSGIGVVWPAARRNRPGWPSAVRPGYRIPCRIEGHRFCPRLFPPGGEDKDPTSDHHETEHSGHDEPRESAAEGKEILGPKKARQA